MVWLCAYAAAVVLGRQTALPETGLSLFWPAGGVAALWLLRSWGPMLAVDLALLFAATVVGHQVTGVPFVAALCFGLANVAVGLCVRWVLDRATAGRVSVPGLLRVFSARELVALGWGSLLAGCVSALPGGVAGHLVSGRSSLLIAAEWAVRNTAGTFVVACAGLAVVAALAGCRGRTDWRSCVTHEPRSHDLAVLGAALAGTVLATGLVFWGPDVVPLTFIPLTVSAFVGYRFAPVVAAVQTLLVSAAAVTGTLLGLGPFGSLENHGLAAMATQGFLLSNSAIAVMLSFGVAERVAVTRRVQELQAESEERAQLLEAVTGSLPHGLAVIDAEDRLLVGNQPARRLVETDPDGRVRTADFEAWSHEGQPVAPQTLPHARVLAGEPTVDADYVVRLGDRETAVVHAHVEPLELGGPRARRVAVLTLRDVTQERGRTAQLESFAGVVAHDLRNPLTAVTSWTQFLGEHLEDSDKADSFTRATVARIGRAGRSMADLIEDLLAYTSASSAPLSLEPLDLGAMVADLAAELRASSPLPPAIETRDLGVVLADRLLVRQVFANLLGNAVKYVAPGVRPHILVSGSRVAETLEIRIADNGIGIPAEARSRVFEGFARAHGSDPGYGGTGLGLAICARAVERHGGTIVAGEGPHGQGTEIILVLPVAAQLPTAELPGLITTG